VGRALVYHHSYFITNYRLYRVSASPGLYGNVPSDVINVYQPPGTDFYITFKSPRMRGHFRWYESRKLAVGRDP
jgi:hypothetical protein